MGLFGRLLSLLLAVGLLPVAATGVWFLRTTGRAEENARALHEQLAVLASDSAEDAIGRLNRAVAFVEDLERIRTSAPEAEFAVMQRAATSYPPFLLLATLDRDGKERVRTADSAVFPGRELLDRGAEAVVGRARETDRFSVGDPEVRQGRSVLPFAYPLLDGRILFGFWDLSSLWKRLGSLKAGRQGRVVVLSEAGQPLAGTAEGVLPPGWRAPEGLGAESGWLGSIPSQSGPMVGAFATTPSLRWKLLTLQPRAEALSRSSGFAARALAFMATLAALVAALAAWFAAALTRPITALAAGADRAAANDLSTRVPEFAWGELKRLSSSFNVMIGRLREVQEMHIERTLEEKSRVDALVTTIPDGIILAGFDGKLTYRNSAAVSMLGLGEGDGVSLRASISDASLRQLAQDLLARRKKEGTVEFELPGAAGAKERFVLARGIVVKGETKDVGILLILRDITYEKEVERTKQTIMETVTHDLRSPLSSIMGMAELMTMGTGDNALNDRNKRRLSIIQSASKDLAALVDDILDVSKFESGSMRLVLKPGRVEPILEAAHELGSVQAAKFEVNLNLEVAPGLPEVPLDSGQVRRVVVNLVSNSLKFTPKGGTVTIAAAPEGGGIKVSVRDTGAGIPADKIGKLFQKFFQVEETKDQARARGTGLGLTVCRMVVEAHGGRIWAESVFGKGSDFQFLLPGPTRAGASG